MGAPVKCWKCLEGYEIEVPWFGKPTDKCPHCGAALLPREQEKKSNVALASVFVGGFFGPIVFGLIVILIAMASRACV